MKWDVDRTNGVMWIAGEAAKSLVGSMKGILGIRFTEHFSYIPNHEFQWCTLEKENEDIGLFLVEKFKDKKFTRKYVKEYRKFDKKSVKELNLLDKKGFSMLSNEQLFKTLEKATGIYIRNFDYGFIIEPMDFVLPNLAETALIRQGYTNAEIADMMSIADTSFLNIEMQKLIQIAKKPKKSHQALLKKHAYNYRWIQTAHMGRRDIPFESFEARLEDLRKKSSKELKKEMDHLKSIEKNAIKRKAGLLKKKPVDKTTKQLIEIVSLITPFHDRRKEMFMRSIYTADSIREEIGKRYGYTREELSVFEVKDINGLLQGKKLDRDYAHELSKTGLLYINTKNNIWRYMVGKESEKFARKELSLDLSGISELKGSIASLGKAQGKVSIINGIKDMAKMQKGNILVTPMTRPEFVSIMKNASAIVTDEGGVTCHAAIVSRELGIPCIIGTKIATKVLKDGDIIDVDADIGMIKIIKR